MSILRTGFLACSVGTAISAFVAARYWYLSSRPSPETTQPPLASIDDDPAVHIMEAQVNIYSIRAALMEASRLNKLAAIWSAIAAFMGAVATIMSII
jgi:hypothetical protein